MGAIVAVFALSFAVSVLGSYGFPLVPDNTLRVVLLVIGVLVGVVVALYMLNNTTLISLRRVAHGLFSAVLVAIVWVGTGFPTGFGFFVLLCMVLGFVWLAMWALVKAIPAFEDPAQPVGAG